MADQYTKRSDSTQLPSATELLHILTKESQRKALRFDFIQKNGTVFDAHRRLSKLAGSDDSWVEEYGQLSLETLDQEVVKNHGDLSQYIQTHPGETKLYEALYTALIPKADIPKSEAIFVFGAATNARIERAIELYKEGVSPKIIISGNSPHYVEGTQSEASRMAEFAESEGIPRDNIVLEEESVTLPDNVKRTIDLLEKMEWRPASLVVVATNFVLTRASMEWYKFCPWDVTITPVAAHPQSPKFTAEGWYTDAATIALVLNEYAKIIFESRIDLLRKEGVVA